MKLSEVVKNYRIDHGMSQRQFSAACNMSAGYISMLEEGVNPRTKEPLVPSIVTMRKLASAMGMRLDDLMSMVDGDMVISLGEEENAPTSKNDSERKEFIMLFASLNSENRRRILDLMQVLASSQK